MLFTPRAPRRRGSDRARIQHGYFHYVKYMIGWCPARSLVWRRWERNAPSMGHSLCTGSDGGRGCWSPSSRIAAQGRRAGWSLRCGVVPCDSRAPVPWRVLL